MPSTATMAPDIIVVVGFRVATRLGGQYGASRGRRGHLDDARLERRHIGYRQVVRLCCICPEQIAQSEK